MPRNLLLFFGFIIFITHSYIQPISPIIQFILFVVGIFFLGIPHGAADLLVATKNAKSVNQKFNPNRFLFLYIIRLIAFGFIIYVTPSLGMVFFIFLAAYHFGEIDLPFFNTNLFIGKVVVCSYGLVILSVILLNDVDELQKLISLSGFVSQQSTSLKWILQHYNLILSITLVFFFCSIFLYATLSANSYSMNEYFILQFAILVILLYNLPLLLGFTFYFIFWHSILSLKNIINYLRSGGGYSLKHVVRQIILYSFIALIGILITGSLGFMFINNQAVIIYIFLGLAVLTLPHMEVMHAMYCHLRKYKKIV